MEDDVKKFVDALKSYQPNEIEAYVVKMQLTLYKMTFSEDFGMYFEIPEVFFDNLSDKNKEQICSLSKQIYEILQTASGKL